jgi:hypothetical protein
VREGRLDEQHGSGELDVGPRAELLAGGPHIAGRRLAIPLPQFELAAGQQQRAGEAAVRFVGERLGDHILGLAPPAESDQRLGQVSGQHRPERAGVADPRGERDTGPGRLSSLAVPPEQFQPIGEVDVSAQCHRVEVMPFGQSDTLAHGDQAGVRVPEIGRGQTQGDQRAGLLRDGARLGGHTGRTACRTSRLLHVVGPHEGVRQ